MIKSKITVAVVAALALSYGGALYAQSTDTTTDTTTTTKSQAPSSTKAKRLEQVTVTGSLIPQTEIETATPITTITAQDIKARGFSTVAEALQQSSFATGTVQGQQTSASFTQGAKTLSLFGLPVGFVKYLIDGRPMGNFPALYNGGSAFNNISGIPADLVDHIDILPGGQSSLYGSDAIAGVVNIVLKKHVDAPSIDVRYGWHKDGGGATQRVAFSDSFSAGKFNMLVGAQYENTQPIWGFDRSLTRQFNTHGTSAPLASRDILVYVPFRSAYGGGTTGYFFEDPANCANVTGLFGGTEAKRHRNGSGDYCGSFYTPGYKTIANKDKTANFYTHTTFDVSDDLQLYGDLLYNYEEQKYSVGSNYTFWSTGDYGAFYDPNLDRLLGLQVAFSPEELGGYQHTMNKQYDNSYMLTLGGRGTFGQSNWDYDLGFTHSDDHLVNRDWVRYRGPIDNYFQQKVLGPQIGVDPIYGYYPAFNPDYAALYQPISQADLRSFTGYATTQSKTWDNMLRGQLTNASLFSLPGGDAGVAVVLEGGNQGWAYNPDPGFLDGSIWGQTAVQGAGHRSRYAATTEFKFPLLSQVTLDVSGRYDSYNVQSQTVSHGTYNLGLEYRPFESLLLRGRYGTAFKAPTLPDEYQGLSGYYSTVTDYLNCNRLGYGPGDTTDCPSPYNNTQFFGQQSGNTKLKPITAKVWSYGVVWAPMSKLSLSVDYLHYNISNEVNQESSDTLSRDEYLCDIGTFDPSSPTCTNAFAKITRGQGSNGLLGVIQQVYTPKVNVSKEVDNAITASANYVQDIGFLGKMAMRLSYSNVLKHTSQSYPGDPNVDLLRHPNYSTDFKTKVNGSVTWIPNPQWSGTVYFNRYGSSPNYLAVATDGYTYPGSGKLSPWILYNASVTYNPTRQLGLSVLVNNVFNKMPPFDASYPGSTGTPYNTENYNVYGRTIYLEANYKFGSR